MAVVLLDDNRVYPIKLANKAGILRADVYFITATAQIEKAIELR